MDLGRTTCHAFSGYLILGKATYDMQINFYTVNQLTKITKKISNKSQMYFITYSTVV
jgi:hypothetical protein